MMRMRVKMMAFSLTAGLLLCTGCKQEQTETVCRRWDREAQITLQSTGDQVMQKEETALITYEELGLSADSEKLQETISNLFQALKADQQGRMIAIKEEADGLQIAITLDFEQADMEQLYAAGLLDQPAERVSLEKTIAGLEELGYTCATERKGE